MRGKIHIEPESIRQGTQITVQVPGEWNVKKLKVSPDNPALPPFEIPLKERGEVDVAFFALDLDGAYRVSAGGQEAWIQVAKQKDLSFGIELGMTLGLVALCLGAVLLWSIRRKKHPRIS